MDLWFLQEASQKGETNTCNFACPQYFNFTFEEIHSIPEEEENKSQCWIIDEIKLEEVFFANYINRYCEERV